MPASARGSQRALGVALQQQLVLGARLVVIPERERAARDGELRLVVALAARVEADHPLVLHDGLPAVTLAHLEDLPEQLLRPPRPGAGIRAAARA